MILASRPRPQSFKTKNYMEAIRSVFADVHLTLIHLLKRQNEELNTQN